MFKKYEGLGKAKGTSTLMSDDIGSMPSLADTKKKASTQQQQSSTVAMFLKTVRMFKKVQEDIDCLEEYYSSKIPIDYKQGGVRVGILSDDASESESKSQMTEQRQTQAKKILSKIP